MDYSYFAQEIKDRISAKEAFVFYGIAINQKGFANCPFHRERTASMKVYDSNRGYHCFGCGKSGDVIAFVRDYFGLSFVEAVKKLLCGSFLPVMAGLFCALLLVGLVLLRLQRYERINYAIDKLGLHAWTYLEDPTPLQLYARLMTPAMVRQLEEDERALPDKTLIRHQFLPWKQVSRAYLWEENAVLLLYRPVWWHVMSVRCPIEELPAIEKLVQIYVKPGRKKSAKGKRTSQRKKKA